MRRVVFTMSILMVIQLTGCLKNCGKSAPGVSDKNSSRTVVRVDGSSTVFPITEAVAEEFQKKNRAKVTIGVSGTGGGFKQFCHGAVSIIGASRPISEEEMKACSENTIEYIELPIAYDGIVVAVNSKNEWSPEMSTAELKLIWEPSSQGKVLRWEQVRKGWPKQEIHLYAPGVDSGTYDYFTQVIVGKAHSSRGDVTSSEDDNVLVQGVSMDPLALGFFGHAYYEENKDKLKAIKIDGVFPTFETISAGTYQPLSRPIFLYVTKQAADDQKLHEFIEYYLQNAPDLVKEVGYIPLSTKAYSLVKRRLQAKTGGSVFSGKNLKGISVESVLGG